MKIAADNGQQWFEFETWEETVAKLDLKYFENPKNDSERLFNAQKRFIVSKFTDQEAEADLFRISETVCFRLIKNELQNRHYTFYTRDEIRDKAAIATDYLVRRYKNYWKVHNTVYYITDGFIVALGDACKYALDYVGREDALDKLKNTENEKIRGGRTLSPEELEEHQQAFKCIEECIEQLNAMENGKNEKQTD